MNPETKLTTEQVQAICSRHDIPYLSHSRITSGFSHEVHRLNDDMVLKAYIERSTTDAAQKYTTESNLLASTLPFPKPRLIAQSDTFEDIDRRYVIMSYVPGVSLGSVWHTATEPQREAIIAEISQALQVINGAAPTLLGLSRGETWSDHIHNRSIHLLEDLQRKDIIGEELSDRVRRSVETSMPRLINSEMYPVFWDIHFDNFLVNDQFKLQALIDLEAVELTALDYPLFVVRKQMEEPEKYFSEADEHLADRKDYRNLENYYRKYYPRMFDNPDIEIRVRVYEVLDRLHLILHWPHVRGNYDKLERLVAELS